MTNMPNIFTQSVIKAKIKIKQKPSTIWSHIRKCL